MQVSDEMVDRMHNALKQVNRLYDEALPKFNWGASALDANAISLLNDTGVEVSQILKELEG